MKTLFLVRHANAGWNSNGSDFDRTLSDRGNLEAEEMAGRFLEQGILPDLLISSPARRAFETAGIFADRMGSAHELIRLEAGIYSGDVDTLAGIVRALPRETTTAMIFGHNPTISIYASWLSGRKIGQMETGSVLRLDLPGKHWSDAKQGGGRAVWYLQPKRRQ